MITLAGARFARAAAPSPELNGVFNGFLTGAAILLLLLWLATTAITGNIRTTWSRSNFQNRGRRYDISNNLPLPNESVQWSPAELPAGTRVARRRHSAEVD